MGFNISNDKRYLQFENIVVDLETGMRFDVDNVHPVIVCEMFKNQFKHIHHATTYFHVKRRFNKS